MNRVTVTFENNEELTIDTDLDDNEIRLYFLGESFRRERGIAVKMVFIHDPDELTLNEIVHQEIVNVGVYN